jgi:hypothetical protein
MRSTSALSHAVYVCSTEVQYSFTHTSRLQRNLEQSESVLDVRRSTAPFRAPVNQRNRFGEKYHASRFSNASHVASLVVHDRIRLAVPVPKLQTRLESDGKRPSCEFSNDAGTPHFRHFSEQIETHPPKRIRK